MIEETTPPEYALTTRITALPAFDAVNTARFWAELSGCDPARVTFEETSPLATALQQALSLRHETIDWLRPLAPDISELAARELLSLAAAAAPARPFLAEALHRHEADERMNAIEILTYGAVVTLVLMVATIEVDWRNGKPVKIKKHALSDATVRALLEVLARIKPPGQN